MEWLTSFTLESGDERKIETPHGKISIRYRDQSVMYRRIPAPVEHAEDSDEIAKTMIIESLGKRAEFSFLPVYPDRPVIFKPEDELFIPPRENGFFCLAFEMGMAVSVSHPESQIEEILSSPRKNSYWGPPNEGLLAYQARSFIQTDPARLMNETGFEIAVVPVYYKNQRDEGEQVERCLIPLEELDLYRSEEGYLVYEVVELQHKEEFYQEPKPIKRPPKELKTELTKMLAAPAKAQSLFQKVRSLPRLDTLTNVFTGR